MWVALLLCLAEGVLLGQLFAFAWNEESDWWKLAWLCLDASLLAAAIALHYATEARRRGEDEFNEVLRRVFEAHYSP